MESLDNPLQLKSVNHISLLCRSIDKSLNFYQNVLGFFPIRRPAFGFLGAWLFNYGMGIHLLQSENTDDMPKISTINPKDNHISFQCESMGVVEKKLKEMEIEFEKCRVEEGGICIDQLFFHDPDGLMIEICNCESLPVIPLVGDCVRLCSSLNCNLQQQQQQQQQMKQAVQINQQQPPVKTSLPCT